VRARRFFAWVRAWLRPAARRSALRALAEFGRSLLGASTWRLALRGLGRQPRRSGIVLTAIAVGLGSLLFAMAFQYGLIVQMVETAIRSEIGDLQAHAPAWNDAAPLEARMRETEVLRAFEAVSSLRAAAPRLRGEALAQSPRASVGVRVLGADPELEPSVSTLSSYVAEGEWLGEAPRRVVLGEGLARRLRVGIADKVVLSVQDARGDLTGEAFRVGGLLRAPSRALDESVAVVRIEDAQRLYAVPGEISEVALAARDPQRLAASKREAAAAIGAAARVETWRDLQPMLVAMIEMFDQMGWIIYAAIFVAMAFGIANVLLMSVFERTREIGVLLAIGMPPARMVAIVAAESLVLVAVGVGLGFGLGFFAIWSMRGGIDLSAWSVGLRAYGFPTLVVPEARSGDVWAPLWVATATALLASLWPALRAVRTRPAEALRRV
jgi:ABC-type lipoprotein release transport system permease subunit